MKIKEVMSPNPVCCTPGDSAQMVARIMRDGNIGSIPVVIDQQSRELVGVMLLNRCGRPRSKDDTHPEIHQLRSGHVP